MLCCANQAVEERGHDHGDSAGDAALDAADDGISFNGQTRAVFGAEPDTVDQRARRCDGDRLIDNGDFFVLLVRKNLAKPSDATGKHEDAAQNADASAGDQACGGERAAEGENNGPRGGRGQVDRRAFVAGRVGENPP